jgi:hypothetical protein
MGVAPRLRVISKVQIINSLCFISVTFIDIETAEAVIMLGGGELYLRDFVANGSLFLVLRRSSDPFYDSKWRILKARRLLQA